MADRVANIIVLVEDQEHQNLVRRYVQRVDRRYGRRIRSVPLPGNRMCGSQYVREQFPLQVKECRRRIGKGSSCILIVLTDADNLMTVEREQTLHNALNDDGQDAIDAKEPIIVLIPKWQVETWIKCLLGELVSEDDKKTDQPGVTPEEINEAAQTLHEWARTKAKVGVNCVKSLKDSLPRWRKIG